LQKKWIKLKNSACLHARPAVKLVQASNVYDSDIFLSLEYGGARANAKSMTSILSLGAAQITELLIETDGSDEVEALDAVIDVLYSL